MSELVQAVRAALETHAALVRTRDSEPTINDEDGLPIDGPGWLRWREEVSVPAYDAWDVAMDNLDDALIAAGREALTSRHPYNFTPICEAILAEVSA